jgi:hypothetical protein
MPTNAILGIDRNSHIGIERHQNVVPLERAKNPKLREGDGAGIIYQTNGNCEPGYNLKGLDFE